MMALNLQMHPMIKLFEDIVDENLVCCIFKSSESQCTFIKWMVQMIIAVTAKGTEKTLENNQFINLMIVKRLCLKKLNVIYYLLYYRNSLIQLCKHVTHHPEVTL